MSDFHSLLGIIDSEYDVICDMDDEGLITYLIEGFNADRATAIRALENFGMIGDE